MSAQIFIPFAKYQSIGGPTTFMKNLHAYLRAINYPIQNEIYHSKGTFFSVQHDLNALKYYRKIGGTVIQRLDGVYYPSQHGKEYKALNNQISNIYADYATHVVFQSHYSRRQCFEMLGIKSQKEYSIIYNGVDKSIFYPTIEHAFLRDGKVRFITVGNFRKKAMIVPLIRALDVLSEKYPLQLTMVGDVTQTELKPYLNRHYIIHVGAKNALDVSQLLRASDIFLHSQLNDNCPNAVIEAISVGLPIVGFNSGSMPELCSFSKDLLADIPYKMFHSFEDFKWEALMSKIELCINHYDRHREISMEHIGLYDFIDCGAEYVKIFNEELSQIANKIIPWNYLVKGYIKQMLRKNRQYYS